MFEHGSNSPEDFKHVIQHAASRLKLERVKVAVSRSLIALAIVFALWVFALLYKPSWIAPFPWAAPLAFLLLLFFALQRWIQRTEPGKVCREIDRRLRLPDIALSATELSGDDGWLLNLHHEALVRTRSVNWNEIWPVPWPKWTRPTAFSCIALIALLGYHYHADRELQRSIAAHPPPRDSRAVAIEELFKDWDQAKERDADLKKMMEKIGPIRERLTAPHSNEKQQFADMVRLEEIVAAEKAKLEAQSLEPQAASLADALQAMEGMGALAAALRKKDFDKATELAKEAADRLAEKQEAPKGTKEAGAAAQQLAQKLGSNGQQAMSQAMSEFSQGAKDSDCKKMANGMNGIKDGLAKQASRNAERKRLSTQLAQLSFCKNPGQCNNPGMCLIPRIAMMKSKQPGKGAGSETDPNRFGAETQIASERRQERMQNTATDGESEATTLKASEGQVEALRGTRSVSFQEYQKLSQQAIADEALPAAHREAIKCYFEKIRPKATK